LHEVRERDIYGVYDSSGRYRGKLEMKGIGDFQSQGLAYYALEDFKRQRPRLSKGERVVYLGQRKLFNLHAFWGQNYRNEKILVGREKSFGGGLLWSVTLRDGWGIEFLFGGLNKEIKNSIRKTGFFHEIAHRATFWAPVWIRKNFFFPYSVSPYLGIGTAILSGRASTRKVLFLAQDSVDRPVLMLGGGIEFFPGRFMHPRLDVRYFPGPILNAGGSTYGTTSIFYSIAVSSSW